jgi:DNA-binding MltR family transcriptional regulator
MPDEPAYIRNFKAFAKSDLTTADLPTLESEMYGTNDRATAVMLSAVAETCLEIFLRSKTRPALNSDDNRLLFDYRGPLGDFSSKIFVAFAFNMYGPETRHDLDLIRMLRNEWAHSRRSFGFATKEVAYQRIRKRQRRPAQTRRRGMSRAVIRSLSVYCGTLERSLRVSELPISARATSRIAR